MHLAGQTIVKRSVQRKGAVMGQRSVGLRHGSRRRRRVRRAGRVGVGHRGAGDGALAGESLEAEEAQETVSELGRHQIVQDRIDCRVEVDHDATKIDHHVENFGTNTLRLLEQTQEPVR